MEHKLILGGEHWLPFARSRIAAIRHLGYASQKLIMPDGSEVEVRVAADQEFIRITGSEVRIEMDSGAVAIGAIGPAAPARYDPGVMHEAGPAMAYNAPFVGDAGEDRSNPGKTSAGQLSGVLTARARFKGRIRRNPRSFYPRIEKQDDEFVPSPSDDTLYAKKVVGILCPASIFTGKCRLYVQAMYGLPLYEYNAAREVVHTNLPLEFVSETSSAPELKLPPFRRAGDTTSYPTMLLNTSCGVWMDPKTGRHWLFKPNTSSTWVAPLRARADVEKLRKWLVPTGSQNDLNETDREHLEAYILAYSLPDHKHAQTTSVGGVDTGGVYPMAYGWKWRWSGDQPMADLVNVGTFEQDLRNTAMVSTHFRLTASMRPSQPGEQPVWDAAIAVVEGPKQWVVYRYVWTLAGPNFALGVLEKTTNQHSLQFECDAPFYCFYLRDELQVCRVKVVFSPAEEPKRTVTPGYAAEGYGAPVQYRTLGLLGGQHEDVRGVEAYFEATFSVGSRLVTPPMPFAKTNEGNRSALTNKVLAGMMDVGLPPSDYQTRSYNVGYPDANGSYAQSGPVFGRWYDWSGLVNYDLEEIGFHEAYNSLATIVAPFYDAEALYVQYSTDLLRQETGLLQKMAANLAGFGYVWENRVDLFGTEVGRFRYYGWNNGGGASGAAILSTEAVATSEVTVLTEGQYLVSHAGVTPATFTNLGEFHSNDQDFVSAQFGTITATSLDEPTLIAPGYAGPVGSEGAPASSVLVGWI